MSTRKYWIGVAAANHIARGKTGGFMQVNHGKEAPLKCLQPGDIIAYYSPVQEFGGKDTLQAFTAIGTVQPGHPYQGDMGEGFKPFRRDVLWAEAKSTPIKPLLNLLSFTQGQTQWGYKFRFGLFEVTEADM
ncbi:MAG: EVE domain-containing protein, partial [Alphaproteobacteria bacterium]|nr:EVE domain-containing protein [Alphaproteobacteria bacterium]